MQTYSVGWAFLNEDELVKFLHNSKVKNTKANFAILQSLTRTVTNLFKRLLLEDKIPIF